MGAGARRSLDASNEAGFVSLAWTIRSDTSVYHLSITYLQPLSHDAAPPHEGCKQHAMRSLSRLL